MINATVWLSQVQFFMSLGFMSMFLLIELGLAWVLLFFKLAARQGADAGWTAAYRFWVRVFALAAALTLAAGMPVLIQLGSLWPGLMDRIGDVAGPLLAGVILGAFVFKSCFLGAMLFGQQRLSERVHTLMVLMVALGVSLTAFCAVALLGWMQTPAGAVMLDGQFLVHDWRQVVFNPAAGWLAGLLAAASMLTVAFLILGVVARQSLWRPLDEGERRSFRAGLVLALGGLLLLGTTMAGYGRMVAAHQPAKAAATAAYWQSGQQPDLVLFAWPDEARGNLAAVRWRHAGGRWLGQDDQGRLVGLDRYTGATPPVALTFWVFRLVLAVALLMGLIVMCLALRLHGRRYDPAQLTVWCRRLLGVCTGLGWVLGLAMLAHVLFGLAPYAVNQAVTLADIAGSSSPAALAGGIVAHLAVYLVLLAGFLQLLRYNARHGVVPVARRRRRA